ncbi:MAG: LpxA family transferase [Aestuariivirga sp.]|uniref:LpxA family transferase n=1 Tax=Aestuariivirga sp. TaxID=2650926 RepID=UPI0038D1D7D2
MKKFIKEFEISPLARYVEMSAWEITSKSISILHVMLNEIKGDYYIADGVAIHRSATIETGAILKEPTIIGPRCFVAHGAYVRGGCWLDAECILGPGAELKSSFLFAGTKLAHFNFVGDSVLGSGCNLEAGSIIANYRNETEGAAITISYDGQSVNTGVSKFGALLGDRVRLGANSVVAPGAILPSGTVIRRLALVDQG